MSVRSFRSRSRVTGQPISYTLVVSRCYSGNTGLHVAVVAMLCWQNFSQLAVRAATVVIIASATCSMHLRCVLDLLASPDPACLRAPAQPPKARQHRWMHDASAFAPSHQTAVVTPETKLHRPADLRGGAVVDGLRDRLHRLFSPGGEMCGSSVESGEIRVV